MREFCTHSPLGDIDNCNDFVTQVLLNVTQGQGANIPQQPFGLDQGAAQAPGESCEVYRMLLQGISNTAQHSMYFLRFNAIGHHLILETHGGKMRLFQCYVKSRIVSPTPTPNPNSRPNGPRRLSGWPSVSVLLSSSLSLTHNYHDYYSPII